jgi:hypothetical protein
MEVICVKNSGRDNLIKGGIYILKSVWDSHKKLRDIYERNKWVWVKREMERKGVTNTSSNYVCAIKGLYNGGGIPISYFTQLDGKKIPEKEKFQVVSNNPQSVQDLEVGDLVMCNVKNLKTLTYKKYYIVKEIVNKSTIRVNNGKKYSKYNFSKVPKDEVRDLNIEELMGSNVLKEKTSNYDKINHLDNLDKLEMIINPIIMAIKYKRDTEVKNVSLREILERKYIGKSSLSIEDFYILKNIDWESFLNDK